MAAATRSFVPAAVHPAIGGGGGGDARNLIVNYIPTPVTDAEFRQIFGQFGELLSARVIIDRATGIHKGYGFAKYRDAADAQRAMQAMDGFVIFNKRLKVTCARGHKGEGGDDAAYGIAADGGYLMVPPPPVMQVAAPPPSYFSPPPVAVAAPTVLVQYVPIPVAVHQY